MVIEKQQYRNKLVLAVIVILVCSIIGAYSYFTKGKQINLNHSQPMVVFKDKDKLWQVVTYKSEPVTSIVITLYPKFKQTKKNVYLNYRSQFVFSDAAPVLLDNEPLFWNRDGEVVTLNGKIINEGLVFLVGNKELARNTALTLYELKVGIKSNIEKQKILDEAIDPDRTSEPESVGSSI